MTYSISQVAKKMNLTPFTLRYYDKEGILSPNRTEKGIRYFTEADLEQLEMICCLKNTGMSIKDIKRYFELCRMGDGTLAMRMEIFTSHRDHILEEMKALESFLCKINEKINWYQTYIDQKKTAIRQEDTTNET
jgi:DNA-binding transcriptional MerR regulator